MGEHARDRLEAIRSRIRRVSRDISLAELSLGVVALVGGAAAFWFLAAAAETALWLSVPARIAVAAITVLALSVVAALWILLPACRLLGVIRGPSGDSIARRVGTVFPEVSDRLTNLLQLAEGRHSSAPPGVIDEAVIMLCDDVEPVSFERLDTFRRPRTTGRMALIPVAALLIFAIAAPGSFWSATGRLARPGVSFVRPAAFTIVVRPGDVEIVRGETVDILAEAVGTDVPPSANLELRQMSEEHVETAALKGEPEGVYRYELAAVRQSLRYRIVAGNVETAWFSVTALDRPLVRELTVELESPAYARLARRTLAANVGDVTALPGTQVRASIALAGAAARIGWIVFDDDSRVPLKIDGESAIGEFTLTRPGTYRIELLSADEVGNGNPITYSLETLTDAPPQVTIEVPEVYVELREDLSQVVVARITDDYGFRRLRLLYRLAERRFGPVMSEEEAMDIPVQDPRQLDQQVRLLWDLAQDTDLAPVPGDVIEYRMEVWDNDGFRGSKSGTSAVHRLRVPSLAERFEDLNDSKDVAIDQTESLLEQTQRLEETFEDLRDELRRKPEADWQDERQLEQLQQMQESLEDGVDKLGQQLEDMSETMQNEQLMSPETMQMFEELQRVVDEIRSPELMEALQKLQESLKNLDLQQMQDALQDFEFSEDLFRQRIERALELMKRLSVQQGLDEAARRAEELARKQEELARKTSELMKQKDKAPDAAQDESRSEDDGKDEGGEDQAPDSGNELQPDPSDSENPVDGSESRSDSAEPPAEENLAREQELSAEEMEQLLEQLEELRQKMDEVRNSPLQEMDELREQLNEQRLEDQMRRNADQLRQEQLEPAQGGQQEMKQQLDQLQMHLEQMMQSMQGAQLQVNIAGLRRALSDVLKLSRDQEELRLVVSQVAAESPVLTGQARVQVELAEGLSTVADTLRVLAREIPEMNRQVQIETGESLREMSNATEALADRVPRRASGHQKGSMTHLNELALLLSDLLSQLMNQQQGGSSGSPSMQQLIEQLQQMSGQQQQINEQIQQLLNDMHGQRLVGSMQERLRQLAEQQERIKQQLKQLSRNPDLRGNVLGDLNRIAEQMEETIRELEGMRANRQTVTRQQEILTRMLDATRSMRERGHRRERESRPGEQPDRTGPPEFAPDVELDRLRQDLIRALESGYAPDYEELIKRYFELLQRSPGTTPDPG